MSDTPILKIVKVYLCPYGLAWCGENSKKYSDPLLHVRGTMAALCKRNDTYPG